MKQIVQHIRTGKTEIIEVPYPTVKPGHVLIGSHASLISAGTERMLVEFGRAGLLGKARQQPDKVRQVFDKIKADGLLPTLEAVKASMDQPLPLGYCNAGEVLEVGAGVEMLAPGDRVVSNGPHAEVVRVPKNLCAKIPEEVSTEVAAFTVLAAVGLQGIRLIQPTLGESIVVIGLGLIGLLTVQLLRAHGCRVLGYDLDPAKCALARQFGAETVSISEGEDPIGAAQTFSGGRGVDAVVITASTTSSEPVHQAAKMCRKRGRIALVGVTGLELNRADFYEKELTFQVSCSYGPGRYDRDYEEKGHDYPIGFVRWTEQRNFQAVLHLMAERQLDVTSLITHRFPMEQAAKAYELITSNREQYLGIILAYHRAAGEAEDAEPQVIRLKDSVSHSVSRTPVIGFIGAGRFAGSMLLPALNKAGVNLKTIASERGVTSTHLGKKFGFERSTSDVQDIFADPEINVVCVATPHDTHARFVVAALEAGKDVFVEKPLCINPQQLDDILETYSASPVPNSTMPLLMVGFNRRFSPHVVRMKKLLDSVSEPKSMIMTVNAGHVPPDHWSLDPEVGGGRIIGEACHFLDLLRFLVGVPVTGVQASGVDRSNQAGHGDKCASITLSFKDGSVGSIHYMTRGHKSFPKERLEAFCAGRILQLDNFRRLRAFGWPGFKTMKLFQQDKGHLAEMAAFIDAVRQGGPPPIPFDEVVEVTKVSFEVVEAMR